jgi:hypothetical protein
MSLLTKIMHWLGVDDTPDPAWRSTGYRYTATGHDEARAADTAERRDELAAHRRKLEALRSKPTKGTR